MILQLAHRKGVIEVQCSELHSEEDGKIVEGRLVFAKVVSTSCICLKVYVDIGSVLQMTTTR